MDTSLKKTSKRSLFDIILIGLLITSVLGFGYLAYERFRLTRANAQIEASLQNIDGSLKDLSSNTNVADHLISADIVDRLDRSRIFWSEVVSDIQGLENQIVEFKNYSSSQEGLIAVTGVAQSVEAVVQLLQRMENKPRVEEAFISSLSRAQAVTRRGDGDTASITKPIQFQLTFTYAVHEK